MKPLYITGFTPEGKPLLGGIFKIKDQCGFPLDASFDLAREKGLAIDYMELLCDAWLSNCLGFDAVVRELDMLGGSRIDDWKRAGIDYLNHFPEMNQFDDPINEFCKFTLTIKMVTAKSLESLCPKVG